MAGENMPSSLFYMALVTVQWAAPHGTYQLHFLNALLSLRSATKMIKLLSLTDQEQFPER